MWIHRFGSPKYSYQFFSKILPWAWGLFALFFSYGLIDGLFFAPSDYQQGDAYRIMFVHVPSAALSLGVFLLLAIQALGYLIWRIKICDMVLKAAAPIGAWFTLLALVTGSLWGKPMWGAWWVWDARLTSELILFFLYLGIIVLRSSIPGRERAAKVCAIVAIIGVIDLPIIHYSVYWWHSLHQGSTLLGFHRPQIAGTMLNPLLAMLAAFSCYFFGMLALRVRQEILVREQGTQWVRQLISDKTSHQSTNQQYSNDHNLEMNNV